SATQTPMDENDAALGIQDGNSSIDSQSRTITKNGFEITLESVQFDVLQYPWSVHCLLNPQDNDCTYLWYSNCPAQFDYDSNCVTPFPLTNSQVSEIKGFADQMDLAQHNGADFESCSNPSWKAGHLNDCETQARLWAELQDKYGAYLTRYAVVTCAYKRVETTFENQILGDSLSDACSFDLDSNKHYFSLFHSTSPNVSRSDSWTLQVRLENSLKDVNHPIFVVCSLRNACYQKDFESLNHDQDAATFEAVNGRLQKN
ncbi:MAG: hypothetical protein V1847_04585, partial [Candidatus Diapherotrites archaeon]